MAGRDKPRVEPVEAAWRRLRRHLDRSDQFWLGFVFTSNPGVAAGLATRVMSNCESRSEPFLLLRPETPRELSRLLDRIELEAPGPPGCTWVQAVFPDADPDVAREWGEAWTVFLQSLNQRRDTLRSRLGGFVLAAPPSVKTTAMQVSTDLWSVVVYLAETEAVSDHALKFSFEAPMHGVSSRYLDHSITLRRQFEHTGRAADLDEAVAAAREAVAASEPSDPSRAVDLWNLAAVLYLRSAHYGGVEDIADAATAARAAVAATPDSDPGMVLRLSNLAVALSMYFIRTGDLHVLDEAVEVGRQAVDATPSDHPELAGIRSNLAAALRTRFELLGNVADADEAVYLARAAAADTAEPGYLSNLGLALLSRYGHSGSSGDLDEAVAATSQAVASSGVGDPSRATYLSNLGAVLQARSERKGRPDDPDKAVAVAREAVDLSPPDHPNRARYLAILSAALRTRFDFVGEPVDLEQALATARAAVEASSPGKAEHVGHLANLAATLRTRFEWTGERDHLDEAVDACRAAVTAARPDYLGRPVSLAHLTAVLLALWEHTHDPADLDEAIDAGRESVAATTENDPERSTRLAELAAALRARFARTNDLLDADAAVDSARAAVAAKLADHPDQSRHLYELGLALRARFDATRRSADYDEALNALRWAAGIVNAPTRARLMAADGWARVAAENDDFTVATDAYRTAVALLPSLAWHGLDRRSRVRHLTDWSSLPVDGAACAARAGRPEEAVELLEHGRSVLLQQALHLRGDVDSLAAAHPELAHRLDEVRAALDAPSGGSATHDARAVDRRMKLAREWDGLVQQIRSRPGFERFMAPVVFSDLRRSGSNGPVVVVNVSRFGSHAFILTGADFHVVELPALDPGDTVNRARVFLELNSVPSDSGELDEAVRTTLSWLWDAVAEPVLSLLGIDGNRADGERSPRIWWCPSGTMTLFPIHAAGCVPDGGVGPAASVLDRAISSYTPTLTALLHARARQIDQPVRQLVVGVSDPPGAGPVPGVAHEVDMLEQIFPVEQIKLTGKAATKKSVLSAVADHTWLHVACSSHVDFSNPGSSAMLLADGPLTVAELASQQLGSAELAYLSGSGTAVGDPTVPTEFTNLAAALQLAGYRHVIGALWSIRDRIAVHMARETYRFIAAETRPEAGRAAEAVHRAVCELRALWPDHPVTWAPYVHIGP